MRTSLTRRRTGILLAAVAIISSCSFEMYAESQPPDIRESQMRARITGEGILISFPIAVAARKLEGTLTVELIDTMGRKVSAASSPVSLKHGESSASVLVAWPQFTQQSDWKERRYMLMWTSVRYRLTLAVSENQVVTELAGIRALGPAVEGLFTLRTIVPRAPGVGSSVHVRVFTENPF